MVGLTLTRYFAVRFAKTVFAGFAAVFFLIYTIDLVEMLRRAGDTPGATGLVMAWVSFLHSPIVAEQALPFAVMFGAMIAFLNLSRKLELVVARAAGVSVWQFLTPTLVVVLLIGVASVVAYNPLSANMKLQAERIEAKLFGGAATSRSVWIRQKSVDGQAVIHADGKEASGIDLIGVQVFEFDENGVFTDRVDAVSASLREGHWLLRDAKIVAPGVDTVETAKYLMATALTPSEVQQAFVIPETVPFWSLPGLVAQTENAGLDATAYRLKYQELLARPVLLAAMVLVAACFSLRFFRMGGVEYMVSGGVASGFVLYVGTKLVSDLGSAGFISATMAGWSPGALGCLVGVYVLLHQEDG